jgi:hypothetical protein
MAIHKKLQEYSVTYIERVEVTTVIQAYSAKAAKVIADKCMCMHASIEVCDNLAEDRKIVQRVDNDREMLPLNDSRHPHDVTKSVSAHVSTTVLNKSNYKITLITGKPQWEEPWD